MRSRKFLGLPPSPLNLFFYIPLLRLSILICRWWSFTHLPPSRFCHWLLHIGCQRYSAGWGFARVTDSAERACYVVDKWSCCWSSGYSCYVVSWIRGCVNYEFCECSSSTTDNDNPPAASIQLRQYVFRQFCFAGHVLSAAFHEVFDEF